MDNFQHYVAGFLLSELNGSLLLVRKTKPAWQAGKLNGIGGKVEILRREMAESFHGVDQPLMEEPADAMVREWNEETGGSVAPEYGWTPFANIEFPRAKVHFFRGTTKQNLVLLDGKHNDVGEPLECVALRGIADRDDMVHNLRWLIPLAFYDPSPGMKTTDGEWRKVSSW